jgi:hypothetical protein
LTGAMVRQCIVFLPRTSKHVVECQLAKCAKGFPSRRKINDRLPSVRTGQYR